MEPYDALSGPDAYAASRGAFERLVSTLASDPARDMVHDELAELLEQQGRELLRKLMQDHLDLRARKEETAARISTGQPTVRGPEGHPRTWRETHHPRLLTSVFGPVRVTRIAYRGRGVSNVHPADADLSLPAGRHSRGLARLAVLEAVRGSFDQAQAAIERRCGRVLGKRRLKELVVAAAVDIAAYYTAKIPTPCTREMPLVIQVDGKGSAGTAKARVKAVEDVYIARYWQLLDCFPAAALIAQDGTSCTEDELKAVRLYLRLCEDELELRQLGWVGRRTWQQWRPGIQAQLNQWPVADEWAPV